MKPLLAILCAVLLVTASFAPPMISEEAPRFTEPQPEDFVVAYYFYNTIRCATCIKLETYAREVIEEKFADRVSAGTFSMQMKNLDEDANKHYIDDYKLFTKALILAEFKNGEQVRWHNLDKIWELVGDKDKYQAYVEREIAAFLEG